MDFSEALSGLWDVWMVFGNWVPLWDPWGAAVAALFLLYYLGRLIRLDTSY